MANVLEQFYQAATNRIPAANVPNEKTLTQDPPVRDFTPTYEGENDGIFTANDWWKAEKVRRKLAGRELNYPLDKDERKILDGGIREIGLEALAFYKSRRYIDNSPFRGKWGIFYLDRGINHIAHLISATYPGYGDPIDLAINFLRAHERFHFKFDMYALSVESNLKRSLYEPLKQKFRGRSIDLIEESLANHEAWNWSKQKRVSINELAYDFMKLQPGAYSRFDEPVFGLKSELAANLIDLNINAGARRDDQARWVGLIPNELLRYSLCPEYFVVPSSLSTWISPLWKMPDIKDVIESPKITDLLKSKYSSLKKQWESTKKKLIQNPGLPGLNFKQWDKEKGVWSVRINDNFRVHLHPTLQHGIWEAETLGPHTAMGHG